MEIFIDNEFYLSQVNKDDANQLSLHLNDKDIYDNTLMIPHPYTMKDAEWWILYVEESKFSNGRLTNWAIRDKNSMLIGGIGFHLKYGISSHRDEIGYWLAKPYWNKGIMTRVVKRMCQFAFEEFNLFRIEAIVFEPNLPSCKVLEKSGFNYEGLLKKYILKDSRYIDGKLFAITR
jgi:RimJ/RimL family protein N-acetyltransferase